MPAALFIVNLGAPPAAVEPGRMHREEIVAGPEG